MYQIVPTCGLGGKLQKPLRVCGHLHEISERRTYYFYFIEAKINNFLHTVIRCSFRRKVK